jgi:hypothetical protein
METGMYKKSPKAEEINAVPQMLLRREVIWVLFSAFLTKICIHQAGMLGHNKFLSGDRCKMYNHFLPNSVDFVQNYHNKAFCGTYSKEGHYFLSACQGWCRVDWLIIYLIKNC